MKFSLAVAFAALCGATTLEFSPMPIAVASSLVEVSASPQAQSKAMQEARASVFSSEKQALPQADTYDYFFTVGEAARRLHLKHEAQQCYGKSLQKAVEHGDIKGMSEAYASISLLDITEGELQLAEQNADTAILQDPTNWRAHYALGLALTEGYAERGRQHAYQKAEAELKTACTLSDESIAQPYRALALLYARSGDYTTAREMTGKASLLPDPERATVERLDGAVRDSCIDVLLTGGERL